MNIYENYLDLQQKKKELDATILDVQCQLYQIKEASFNAVDSGTIHYEDEAAGFKLSITKKMNIKVDQKLAEVVGVGFTRKLSFNKTAYLKLNDADRKRVDECLTETPGKPSFKVEAL